MMRDEKKTSRLLGVALKIHGPEYWSMRDVQTTQVIRTPLPNQAALQPGIFRQRLEHTTLGDHRCREGRVFDLPLPIDKSEAQTQSVVTLIKRFDRRRQIETRRRSQQNRLSVVVRSESVSGQEFPLTW